jgi:uncharacterized DUF497 family protein
MCARHRVKPTQCEELFFNRPLIVDSDEKHSERELRLYALGQTDGARLLFVAFTIRGRLIGVVSARDMSRKERRVYKASAFSSSIALLALLESQVARPCASPRNSATQMLYNQIADHLIA